MMLGLGPHLQHSGYRLGDQPLSLSHKRVSEELQWKTESPVSVSARIFRPPPQSTSHQPAYPGEQQIKQQPYMHQTELPQYEVPVSTAGTDEMFEESRSPMTRSFPHTGDADTFKSGITLYRSTLTGESQFSDLEQVWSDGCL